MPILYGLSRVLQYARSSLLCPNFYTVPEFLYRARSSIVCPNFYSMPRVLFLSSTAAQSPVVVRTVYGLPEVLTSRRNGNVYPEI